MSEAWTCDSPSRIGPSSVKARAFTDEVLVPLEDECEETRRADAGAATPPPSRRCSTRGFNGINHSTADGGQGHDMFQQMLIEEQWGRATGALWDIPWRPSIPLAHGTEEQKERFLRPAIRGERRDAYAITEEGAGSDVTAVATTAPRDGDAWVLDGEKWHVTSGDVADFFLVHAHVDGDPPRPRSSSSTRTRRVCGSSARRGTRTRSSSSTRSSRSTACASATTACSARSAQGFELTKDWFVEERIMIGARTMGASARALDLSLAFAKERRQFGSPIADFQAIEFMLADMAAEIMAAKSLLYRVCWDAARGDADRKQTHAMASAVKLVCSETAGRVIDNAVQIFGGRGYMREQPVERMYRELRVDRIWEGTSEIQRIVIGNELRKRGPDLYTGWPFQA